MTMQGSSSTYTMRRQRRRVIKTVKSYDQYGRVVSEEITEEVIEEPDYWSVPSTPWTVPQPWWQSPTICQV